MPFLKIENGIYFEQPILKSGVKQMMLNECKSCESVLYFDFRKQNANWLWNKYYK